ncbi:MAG TPA: hypothetical protein VGK96_05680 [Candidatus Sulfotelmatobacter sp.]|jgi:hypothetical protein
MDADPLPKVISVLENPVSIGVERFGRRLGKPCGDGRRAHRVHVVEEE